MQIGARCFRLKVNLGEEDLNEFGLQPVKILEERRRENWSGPKNWKLFGHENLLEAKKFAEMLRPVKNSSEQSFIKARLLDSLFDLVIKL